MATLFIVIHVLVSLFLIVTVLIQGGKGAQLGSAFGGGSSQTLFGGRGAATFMNKLTTVVAVVFMLTSLLLTLVSVRKSSVIKHDIAPVEKTIPAPPTSGVTPDAGGVKPAVPEKPSEQK